MMNIKRVVVWEWWESSVPWSLISKMKMCRFSVQAFPYWCFFSPAVINVPPGSSSKKRRENYGFHCSLVLAPAKVGETRKWQKTRNFPVTRAAAYCKNCRAGVEWYWNVQSPFHLLYSEGEGGQNDVFSADLMDLLKEPADFVVLHGLF